MPDPQPPRQRRSFPSSGEDWSIIRWWRNHPRQGLLWAEVVIGRSGPGAWPNPRSYRAIDAVHFPGHSERAVHYWRPDSGAAFAEQASGAETEIVEAKKELNFDVIGQCIAGVDMYSRAYPHHGLLVPVAVVRGTPDPALAWICARRGIAVDACSEEQVSELRRSGRLA